MALIPFDYMDVDVNLREFTRIHAITKPKQPVNSHSLIAVVASDTLSFVVYMHFHFPVDNIECMPVATCEGLTLALLLCVCFAHTAAVRIELSDYGCSLAGRVPSKTQ